jgi:hypothetical protein
MNQQLNIANLIGANGRPGIFVAMLWLASPAVAGLNVTAHISRGDVQKVCAVIRAATREPIISIDPVYSLTSRPGAIPRNQVQLELSKDGKLQSKPSITYEFTDEVSVRTGSDDNVKGRTYGLRRTRQGWEIVGKSIWIH